MQELFEKEFFKGNIRNSSYF